MRHIRTVKPEFFEHEGVNELSLAGALGWIGIWSCSDKHGRFEWRPKVLKRDIFPYRDDVNFDAILAELLNAGFVEKYSVEGVDYGWTPTWKKHQGIGTREADRKFEYPAPPKAQSLHSASTVPAQSQHNAMQLGIGVGVGVEVGIEKELAVGSTPARDATRVVRARSKSEKTTQSSVVASGVKTTPFRTR